MSTIPTPPTLNPVNQAFYNWLLTFSAYVGRTYGLTMYPIASRLSTDGGPYEVDAFWLICPALASPNSWGQPYAINSGQMNSFSGQNGMPGMSALASIVLSAMAFPNPAPQPIIVATARPVAPAPPAAPIGAVFTDAGVVNYTDLGSPSTPIGGTYAATAATAVHPAGVFVKQGDQTPFGVSYWWVLQN